jgi:C1A family cysteine protease
LRYVNGRNFVTAVKDQGACASGPAFAATSVVESTFKVQRRDPDMALDLSEAHLFYCHAKAQGVHCGTGWSPDRALECYKNLGVVDEACFPYTAGNQDCRLCSDWQNRITKITGYHKISAVADMKNWISTRGPLLATFLVYRDLLYYQGGIYRHVSGEAQGGPVCTAIIGYDDAGGFWICKHQWGTRWGESGFLRIAYGECGIESLFGPYAIEGIEETGWLNSRKVLGLWTSDHDRNAWVYLDGKIGWRRIAADNDNIFINLLTQLASAKLGNRPINVYQTNAILTQLYVL